MRKPIKAAIAFSAALAVLAIAPAAGRAEESQATALIEEGIRSYLNADLINALQKFKAAVDSGEIRGKSLGEAYKYLAVCQFALGDRGDAVMSFTRALENDPELVLAGDEFNPALVRIFDKLRTAYVSDFEVLSEPSKTAVYLNGVRVGETPLVRTNMFRTRYRLRLERDRYTPVEIEIDLKQQGSYALELMEVCGVREMSLQGIKGGKPQEKITERSDAISLSLTYSGCAESDRRIRRMELRDTISGRVREVFPVYFPHEAGVVWLTMKTPPEGWQPGRFEFRVRPLDAAEEEGGKAVQFAVER
jgi:tetratricopeptide (TPR) repeat protein